MDSEKVRSIKHTRRWPNLKTSSHSGEIIRSHHS